MQNWKWKQGAGELYLTNRPVVTPFATGYSGLAAGKNNPAMESSPDMGPIPRGWYTVGEERNQPAPVTLVLEPDPENQMFGRNGFLIHADNIQRPGWASTGCIIIAKRSDREAIRDSGVSRLEVVE